MTGKNGHLGFNETMEQTLEQYLKTRDQTGAKQDKAISQAENMTIIHPFETVIFSCFWKGYLIKVKVNHNCQHLVNSNVSRKKLYG